MKHAIIMPTKYIDSDLGDQSDFILALSHLLDEDCQNDYATAIKNWRHKTGGKVILDNGLYENHVPESGQGLWAKAYNMQADSVFAPDYLYDCQATREGLTNFLSLKNDLERQWDTELCGVNYVIQANDPDEYVAEFKAAQDYNINMIGLSILSVPNSFKKLTGTDQISINRAIAISLLNNSDIEIKKPAHLLGLGESLVDVVIANTTNWCVSNDSCLAFWAPIIAQTERNGYGVLPGGKPKTKLDFEFDRELTKEERFSIRSNLSLLHSI